MSAPIFVYANLTGLLAGISESDRVGKYVHAYCPKSECAVRWATREADCWNAGKKLPNGKPVLVRSYLRCHSCHSRLKHYRPSDSQVWRDV